MIKPLGWRLLPHSQYSLDLTPADYYLFSSMGHVFAEQYFDSQLEAQNWSFNKNPQIA